MRRIVILVALMLFGDAYCYEAIRGRLWLNRLTDFRFLYTGLYDSCDYRSNMQNLEAEFLLGLNYEQIVFGTKYSWMRGKKASPLPPKSTLWLSIGSLRFPGLTSAKMDIAYSNWCKGGLLHTEVGYPSGDLKNEFGYFNLDVDRLGKTHLFILGLSYDYFYQLGYSLSIGGKIGYRICENEKNKPFGILHFGVKSKLMTQPLRIYQYTTLEILKSPSGDFFTKLNIDLDFSGFLMLKMKNLKERRLRMGFANAVNSDYYYPRAGIALSWFIIHRIEKVVVETAVVVKEKPVYIRPKPKPKPKPKHKKKKIEKIDLTELKIRLKDYENSKKPDDLQKFCETLGRYYEKYPKNKEINKFLGYFLPQRMNLADSLHTEAVRAYAKDEFKEAIQLWDRVIEIIGKDGCLIHPDSTQYFEKAKNLYSKIKEYRERAEERLKIEEQR